MDTTLINSQLYQFRRSFVIVLLCFFSILSYELFALLPEERKKMWHARNSTAKWFYFFNRYATFVVVLFEVIVFNTRMNYDTCSHLIKAVMVITTVVPTIAYQSILVLRCGALYDRRFQKYIYGGMGFLMTGEAFYNVWPALNIKPFPYFETIDVCVFGSGSDSGSFYFLFNFLLDALIAVLTYVQAFRLRKQSPDCSILKIFVREGLQFLGLVFLFNLANIILFFQTANRFAAPMLSTPSIILSSLLCSRLVLSLRHSYSEKQTSTDKGFAQSVALPIHVTQTHAIDFGQIDAINLHQYKATDEKDGLA